MVAEVEAASTVEEDWVVAVLVVADSVELLMEARVLAVAVPLVVVRMGAAALVVEPVASAVEDTVPREADSAEVDTARVAWVAAGLEAEPDTAREGSVAVLEAEVPVVVQAV